jgi:hypothetical protein
MSKLLVAAMLLVVAAPPSSPAAKEARCTECVGFAENEVWVKGGIGTLGDGIYVAINSPNNEVIVQGPPATATGGLSQMRWTGRPAGQREVVVIFERKVWGWSELPSTFDMSRAMLVSFEASRVRFFDFAEARGAFFKRKSARQ